MNNFPFPYIPGVEKPRAAPLDRFLPLLPTNMVQERLVENVEKGKWIIDPFGTSPQLAMEAARAGYKVLVICNNPVLQFMYEFVASSPSENEFSTALAEFAKEKRDSERIETILRGLYQTECPHCGSSIPVQYFIWEHKQRFPKSKFVLCERCQTEGFYPLSSNDFIRLEGFGHDALNRARALQSVNISPESSIGAEEAIDTYLPRSLHFLLLMISRINRMQTSERNKHLLTALYLHALDEGNMMWAWPVSRHRPKQISVPVQFRENNLWTSIENAVHLWSSSETPVPFAIWPQEPVGDAGICLFKGRSSSYVRAQKSSPIDFEGSITIFPRPNQAFWTYSALWTGWIWGREEVFPLRSSLERRRFDWFWYCRAVHTTLSKLRTILPDNFHFWGILPEIETGFLISTIIAAESAGFHLQDIALRNDDAIAQNLWHVEKKTDRSTKAHIVRTSYEAMEGFLMERNEPASRLELIAASMLKIAQKDEIPLITETMPYFSIQEYQQKIPAVLADSSKFVAYESIVGSIERQSWWLKSQSIPANMSLSDRVEQEIIDILNTERSGISKHAIDKKICAHFPGLMTPKKEFVDICLRSYAEPAPHDPQLWQIKPHEIRTKREEETQKIKKELVEIGSRLEFCIRQNAFIDWCRIDTGETLHRFFITPTAIFTSLISGEEEDAGYRKYIVFPGSRSQLIAYKLDSNPKLKELLKDWRLLKNRIINSISMTKFLDYQVWDELIASAPPQKDEPLQISIFD